MKIAISGATGFIGQNLIERLKHKSDIEIIALSRQVSDRTITDESEQITWKKADAFSLYDLETALEGVDVLVYLLHSMLPTARLAQGRFQDFDLVLADNAARAAAKRKVKQIIYMGGLIPKETQLSAHLESRLEVEKVLASFYVPVTTLRAGLVIGPNGSSFTILQKMVEEFPYIFAPPWINNKSSPIDIRDVCKAIEHSLLRTEFFNKSFDLQGVKPLSYKSLITQTARVKGKNLKIIQVPFIPMRLSARVLSWVCDRSIKLILPLIKSLKHNMIANPKNLLPQFQPEHTEISHSLDFAMHSNYHVKQRMVTKSFFNQINFKVLQSVRSIQRLHPAIPLNAIQVGRLYMKWLPKFFRPFINVIVKKDNCYFKLFNKLTLLHLFYSEERSSADRTLFYIHGGLLDKKSGKLRGRLEFRRTLNDQTIIAAIHDFQPALPWPIYKYTQALVHLWVMWAFNRFLKRIGKKKSAAHRGSLS